MIGIVARRLFVATFVVTVLAGTAMGQASLGLGGYTEDFNSMGAGTAPPTGWKVLQIAGASGTWINDVGNNNTPDIGAIPDGTSVAGGTASAGLVVADAPTANQVNGYNALGASGAAGDRGIATAPTGIAGSVIELTLANNTGLPLSSANISYDIRRYQAGADNTGRTPGAGIPEGSEELPGYWLFFSLDNGANFTAVNSLIPVGAGPSTQPIVPNTLGVTSVQAATITFGGSLTAGSNLILRFVDDNAIDPSPDEIIGLDNVNILGIPEPSTLLLTAVGLIAVGIGARRRG